MHIRDGGDNDYHLEEGHFRGCAQGQASRGSRERGDIMYDYMCISCREDTFLGQGK